MAAHAEHGDADSGVTRASRHAFAGEAKEGAAAELPASVDLSGEVRSGGGMRRRRRRPPRRGREEGEGGDSAGNFAEKPWRFC